MPRMENVELKDFTTGTWNVRTLYKPGNLTTAILELERYRLDIIAIQEVRWTGEGSLKTGNWTVFHSGGDEHQGGVGFIVNDKILHRVKKFKAVNDRICHMELECRWFNVILINGYAPTEDKEDEIKDIFYENLENECDRIPTNKVKILLGDFNAKIGQEVEYRPTIGKESLHRTSNDNGTRLVNFATTRNMIISSTTFPHKDIHKETWVSPSGQIKNQIDHVVVDRRFKRCVMDVRSMRGSSAMSDHFIVRAKIKLRLSVEWRKKNVSIKRFNIEDLKNQEINIQYKNKLKETLNLTENSNNVDNNVDNLWNEIENSIKTVATEVLGFEERKRGKKWFDEQCKKANNERDIARIKMLKDPSEENKRVLSARQRETKQLFRKKKRAWENSRLEIIENSYKNNVRLFFEKANEIKNGFKTKATIIKDEEGLLITDKKKAANEFRNMFETMLNQPTRVEVEENLNTVEQRLDEPTLEEVERAVNMLKNRKAPGEDAIVAELLKEGGKELMTRLKRLVDNIWKQEEIPVTWHMSVLCPVHKKGDAMVCQNYRGISLLNTCYKLVSNIILNRIKPYTREIIGEYQAGFTSGKSTVDQIHTIKQIVEKSHEFDIDVHLLFVDFKQAYDSVNRGRLWKAMTQLGIPTKLVRLIKTCVQKSKCIVKFNGEISEDFSVETGLRQGDALSPTLFNIALESVVREVLDDDVTGLRIRGGHQITLAAYADDIIIMGETEEDLKRSAEKLISKGKEIGLQVNEGKTKYLIVSRREQVQNSLVVGGFTFERVTNFKYLGVDVNQQANSHDEIKRRITAGNKSYFALVPIFKSRLISKNTKIRLYKVLIRPIVLYACGAWASTKSDEKRLLLFERKILRRIYGPKRNEENVYERRTNAELRAMFNEPNIVGILKSRRISWAGHVWRAEGQTVYDVTMWKPNKKRPIGRPRQRWTDRVKEDLKLLGIREGEQLAKNRELWRGVVEAAMDLQGPE